MIKFYLLQLFYNPMILWEYYNGLILISLSFFGLFLRKRYLRIRLNTKSLDTKLCNDITGKSNLALFQYIGDFYIRNFYILFFKLICYFTFTIFIILFLRIYFLGTERQLYSIVQSQLFNYKMYPIFIISLICYSYLNKIIKLKLYPTVRQLHIYLQGNDTYIQIEDWYKDYYFGYFNSKREAFMFYLGTILDSKEKLFNKDPWYKGWSRRFIVRSRKYLATRILLKNCIGFFRRFFLTGRFWVYFTNILYYLPYIILLTTFIYDIFVINIIYYIYYALLVLLLTNINKKVREFMYISDPLLDRYLYCYFYAPTHRYNEIQEILDKWKTMNQDDPATNSEINNKIFFSSLSNEYTAQLYYNEEMAEYIDSDFKVYYARDSAPRVEVFRECRLRVKRWLILITFTIISLCVLYNYNQYILKINTLDLKLSLAILLIPTLVMVFVNPSITKVNYETEVYTYNNKAKFIFWFCLVIQVLFFILLFLKNRMLPYPEPLLWDYGFQLIQLFTVEDKVNFVYLYAEQFGSMCKFTEESKSLIRSILKDIPIRELILNNDISFKILKDYVENIYIITFKTLPDIYINNLKDMVEDYNNQINNLIFAYIGSIVFISTMQWLLGSRYILIPKIITIYGENPSLTSLKIWKAIFCRIFDIHP